MVVRMRHTSSHTRNRRSHHALTGPAFAVCEKCHASHIRHRACPQCGTYRGKAALDVTKKLARIEKKEKERAKAEK